MKSHLVGLLNNAKILIQLHLLVRDNFLLMTVSWLVCDRMPHGEEMKTLCASIEVDVL